MGGGEETLQNRPPQSMRELVPPNGCSMNLITMALLATTAVSGQPGSVLDRAGVEKAVLDYRRAMQRGQMVLTQNIYSNGATTPGNKRKTAIWFDGKQIRNDITYLDDKDEPLRRDVECRNCECDSCYVDYTTYKAENTPIALSIHRMLLEKTPSPDAYSVLDPRLLGMVVEASANLARSDSALDSFVNAPNRQQVTMRPDTWKGMDCQRIDYPTGIDYPNVRIWVVPAWGYSVGRIQIGADRFMRYVESNYRQFGPAKIWFPESCVYEDVADGKSVRKEEVAVQVVSLNEPLSPDAEWTSRWGGRFQATLRGGPFRTGTASKLCQRIRLSLPNRRRRRATSVGFSP
jgi:hypothetical protein